MRVTLRRALLMALIVLMVVGCMVVTVGAADGGQEGTITPAYTRADGFWGEGTSNSGISFVVELYEGETKIASTTLKDDSLIDGDVTVTWKIPFNGVDSNSWDVEWVEGYPKYDMNPDTVKLVSDGVVVATNVVKYSAADDLNKIVALADDGTNGVKAYTSLADAVGAGGSVALVRDVTLTATLSLPEGKKVTLDLNGYTVNTDAYYIENNGTLTVKNGTLVADTYNDTSNGAPILNKGTLTIDNGTTITGVACAIRTEGGSVEIKEGATVSMAGRSNTTCNLLRVKGGTVTISGGTFTGCVGKADSSHMISADSDTTVTISGGTFTSFNGGTNNGLKTAGTMTITGGTFTPSDYATNFAATIAKYIPTGYEYNEETDVVAKIAPNGTITPAYTKEVDGYVRVWGEATGNATESMVMKLYAGDTLIATTVLNNVGGIIDGDVFVTWHFFYPSSNDNYWTTTWEEGQPNPNNQPTKVVLYVDGEKVAENVVKMNGPDDTNSVVWEELGGVAIPVAKIGETTYSSLQKALDAAAASTGEVTVEILADIDLTGVDWNPVTVSAPGYPTVTVNGNNHTITGLNDMLFAGTWAGNSGLIINDLTIKNSKIENDVNDTAGNVGVGAFIGFPQASATITLNNCHLVNSTVSGGHWTGGLIGYAAGYAGNDGPVFMNLTIKNCSVTGSTITGKGSVGGIIGHGSGNGWTNVVITNTTVSGNTITSTGDSTVKAGSVMGTIGAAGQPTTVNGETKTGGASVSATVSGNTVTSGDATITTIYGRQGTTTGMLVVSGGSYDTYPIEKNVSYAAPIEGYEIVGDDTNGYSVKAIPVAQIGETQYSSLKEAINAAKKGETVKVLADHSITVAAGDAFTGQGYITLSTDVKIDMDGHTITVTSAESDPFVKVQTSGKLTITGNGTINYSSEKATVLFSAETNGTICIENGTFTVDSSDNTFGGKGSIVLTGGIFDEDVTSYCAKGYGCLLNADSKYEVFLAVAEINGVYYKTLAEAFTAAVDGDEVEILVAGTYALSTSGKDITITGAVDGVVFDNIGAMNMGGANVTFNNVTFDYYPNVNYTGLQHSGNLVYNNCTINGQVFLYGASETFKNCTFNQNSADAYNVWTYGAKEVTFNECVFNSVGKAVLIYSETSTLVNDVTVTDCDFIATAAVDGKAAIEMDSSLTAGINLTIDAATTAKGFDEGSISGNSLWNNKKGNNTDANNDITVVVAGETVLAPVTFVAKIGEIGYTSLADAIKAANDAAASGATLELLADAVFSADTTINKGVTVIAGDNKVYVKSGTLTIAGTFNMINAYGKGGFYIGGMGTDEDNGSETATVVVTGKLTVQNTLWIGSANGVYESSGDTQNRFKLIVDGGTVKNTYNSLTIRHTGAVEIKNEGYLSGADTNIRGNVSVDNGTFYISSGNLYGETGVTATISLANGAKLEVKGNLDVGGAGSSRTDRKGKIEVNNSTVVANSITIQSYDAEIRGELSLNGDNNTLDIATFTGDLIVNANTTMSGSVNGRVKVVNDATLTVAEDKTLSVTSNVLVGNDNYLLTAENSGDGGKLVVNGTLTAELQTNVDDGGVITVNGNMSSPIICVENGGITDATSGQMTVSENGTVTATFLNVFAGGQVTVDGTVTLPKHETDQNQLNVYDNGKVVVNGNLTSGTSAKIGANGALEIAGTASVANTLTLDNGTITLTDVAATLTTATKDLAVGTSVADYKVVYAEGAYTVAAKVYVAQIGETKYESFEAALNAVQNGEIITVLNVTSTAEANKEIDFNKDIKFTITGTAPNYVIPTITFQNATVNIKDATILTEELDARQNATINVIDSTVYDADNNGIVKSYFNGAINISGTSVVYTMQVTTMGYITVSDTAKLIATWQTNVYGNGMITVEDNAVFNTAALHLTGKDYVDANDDRSNTDADRVGKPATIVVDGATLIIGEAKASDGDDYSYNSKKGINIGTIDGKNAVLDIKNNATVAIKMASGETANIGAGGTVNVNASTLTVECRKEDGSVTLANAGTIYVTGKSVIAATMTGAGWVYMNGVNLDADTKLYGAKVGFINGTNTIVGSTIDNGYFSVGIGQDDAATAAAAFATANGITLGDVTVNVSGGAVIGGNGTTYSGWVGSAYSADKTQHKYVLNIENSLATFGYMHVSKDGTLNVTGHSTNKYTHDNANVDFYAGELIVNGSVTLDGTDAWVKFTKMSVDAADGVLNIINGTKYEASIHNGSTIGAALKFWKAGEFNVDNTSTVEIDNETILVSGAELNLAGNITAKGTVTNNGTITLTAAGATLTAPEGLTVGTDVAGYVVVYKDGTYTAVDDPTTHYIYNLDELKAFRDSVNAGNTYEGITVYLAADIDLNNEDWTPIGNSTHQFKGSFDGGEHTITNLTINDGLNYYDGGEHYVGLFGYIKAGGYIKNLTIKNVKITGCLYVGGVVGRMYASGVIENCHLTGDIDIEGYWYVGGIVGRYEYGSGINSCSVKGTADHYATIEADVNATTNKDVDGSYVGSIIGFTTEPKPVVNITNNAAEYVNITGATRVGGIIGIAHQGNILKGNRLSDVNIYVVQPEGYNGDDADTFGLIAGACQGTSSYPVTFEQNTATVTTVFLNGKVVGTGEYGGSITDATPVTNYVARIGTGNYFTSIAEALRAAQDGQTIELISGDAVISMAGVVCGNKTVTITGTAVVDWTLGNLWIGREGEGDGKVIFDGANITSSAKKNPASTGIHVSGGKANDNKTNDGILVIKDSTIELDYLINRNEVTVEVNSNVTIYGGIYTHGRAADESASGEDETATLTIGEGSTVTVVNENGMGVGGESKGIMTVNGTYKANVLNVSAIGTVNVNGSVEITGKVTNKGTITLTDVDATLTTATTGLTVNSSVENTAVTYAGGAYKLIVYVAKIGDTYYATLAEALKAAKSGNTIDLLGNSISDVAGFSLNGINLANGSITFQKGARIGVGGDVVLDNVDLTFDMDGTSDYPNTAIYVNGGSIKSITLQNGSNVLIKNPGYTAIYNDGSSAYALNIDKSTLTIEGKGSSTGINSANITLTNGAKLTTSNTGIAINGGSVNVDGTSSVTVNGTSSHGITNVVLTVANGGVVDVDNCKYLGLNIQSGSSIADGAQVTVDNCGTGGNYVGIPARINEASCYDKILVDNKKIVAIGNKGNAFTSLEAAVEAANDGETVTLLADVTLSEILTINKGITLDGNGKTLTSTAGRAINIDTTKTVKIQTLTIVGGTGCERGINIINNAGTTELAAVTVSGVSHYAVHVATSAGAAKVQIDSSHLTGYAAIAVYGEGSEIIVTDSALNGVNTWADSGSNTFAAIAIGADNVTVATTRGTITASATNTAKQYILSLRGEETGVVVTLNSELVLGDGGTGYLVNVEFTDATVSVKEKYATDLGKQGYATKPSATDGLVTVTGNAVAKINDTYYASLAEAIAAVGEGDVVIELVADATLDYNAREAYGTAETTSLTIKGNKHTLTLNQKDSDWSSIGLANADAKLVLNNMTIEKTGYGTASSGDAWNTHAIIFTSNLEMENVTVNNGISVQDGATLTNVDINEAYGYYGLWIEGNGQSVTVNGGAINATNGGRGIKIADQYVDSPESVTLTVKGMKFNTAKKAAVLVTSTAGAKVTAENVVISSVEEDSTNFVWVDEERAAHYGKVTVTGGTKTQESIKDFPIVVKNGDEIVSYFKTLDDLFDNVAAYATVSNVTVELTGDVVATKVVKTNSLKTYNFVTNVADGVTMDLQYADNWNYFRKVNIGEGVTVKAKYLVFATESTIAGTVDAYYPYISGGKVTVAETGVLKYEGGDGLQVKGNGAVLTVNGTVIAPTINVWGGNAQLIVSGANAKVESSWIDIWDGTPSVKVENEATLKVTAIKASRGGTIAVTSGAVLDAGSVELGHNGESLGTLTIDNAQVKGEIKLTAKDSTVTGPEGMNVTTEIADSKVVYEDGVYKVAAKVYVAEVNGVKYELDEALAAWTNGTTLKLLADVTLTDTIKLKSTEHHILDLGTYTMTAADGKNAIEVVACGNGGAEKNALTINADATNPGGINAGNKCIVYYSYTAGGIDTADRPIIEINGGVFTCTGTWFGGFSATGHSESSGKRATFKFNGGTMNCSVSLTKTKLIITGGTFNGNLSCTGDSTSYRLISGGTFKNWLFMTADDNNTKFWIGTEMGKSDVGVYVDDNGYLVVGGAVIEGAGDKFAASSTNYSGWSSLLKYSSAATNGLYYTSAEKALAANTAKTSVVTVYVDKLDMTNSSYKGTLNIANTLTVTYAEDPEPAWTVAAVEEGKAVVYTESTVNGVVTRTYRVIKPVAQIGEAQYESLAEALLAAKDGETIELIWAEGDAPIAMNGYVSGKTVTITGTAQVDWEKGFLFVGRTNDGTTAADAKLIFEEANLTTTQGGDHGIHVSGAEKDSATKANGTVEFINSIVNLSYLINKGTMTLDNSTLTVKSGFSIGGRPASETPDGEDATATITLSNGSTVTVDNHNGMGLGYEAIGVMNIDATSTFVTTMSFLVTAKGTMNVAGKADIAGTLTNKGTITLTAEGATLTTATTDLTVGTNVADYKVVYADGAYKLVAKTCVAQINDGAKYETLAEALEAAEDGDTITLLADVTLTAYLNVTTEGEVTLDLNGKSITRDNGTALFVNGENTVLTIEGEGTVKSETHEVLFINAGTVKIKSGTFTSGANNGPAVYVINKGHAEIYGGTFSNANGVFVLNEYDATRDATSITVYGGTFVAFNPQNNASEGAGTNFVAKGYEAKDLGDNTWGVEATQLIKVEVEMIPGAWGTSYITVENWNDLVAALGENTNVPVKITLLEDITLTEALTISGNKTVEINLNGHTITTAKVDSADDLFDAFTILADVTIKGEGTIDARPSMGYIFYVGDKNGNSGNLTIENGTFYGDTSVVNNRLGTVTVNGGTFEVTPYNGSYEYTFNCIDANYQNRTAQIVVKGGTFVGFNPQDNAAEGAHTNFCAEGYVAIEDNGSYTVVISAEYEAYITVNGTKKYFVTLEDAVAFANLTKDNGGISDDTIYLLKDVTLENTLELTEFSTDIFGNGHTITSTASVAFKFSNVDQFVKFVTIDITGAPEGSFVAEHCATGNRSSGFSNSTITAGTNKAFKLTGDAPSLSVWDCDITASQFVVSETTGTAYLRLTINESTITCNAANGNIAAIEVYSGKFLLVNSDETANRGNKINVYGQHVVYIAALALENYSETEVNFVTQVGFLQTTNYTEVTKDEGYLMYVTGEAICDGKSFVTLEDAVNYVNDNKYLDKPITLVADVTIEETIVMTGYGNHIELNGYTLTYTGTGSAIRMDCTMTNVLNGKIVVEKTGAVAIEYNNGNQNGFSVRNVDIEAKNGIAFKFSNAAAVGVQVYDGSIVAATLIKSYATTATLNIGNNNPVTITAVEGSIAAIEVYEGKLNIGVMFENWTFEVVGQSVMYVAKDALANYTTDEFDYVNQKGMLDNIGMELIKDAGYKTYITDSSEFTPVAQIGNTYYATLEDAVKAAQNGDTITLLADTSGNGIIINKSIIIALGDFTYTISGTLVGSNGTQSLGFQILEGNTVTITNGAIEMGEGAKRGHDGKVGNNFVIQNYADLTLNNVSITGNSYTSYVVSINSGDVEMTGTTSITAVKTDAVAFDVCKFGNYTEPTVTVADTVAITGKIEAAAKIGNTYYATFDAALVAAKKGENITIILLAPVTVTTDTIYDLGSVTVESAGDAFVVTSGTLTLNGDGVVKAGTAGVGSWCAVWANGGNAVINGGTYSVGGDKDATDKTHQNDVIYTKNGGTVTINGGKFLNDGTVWTLNQKDASAGTEAGGSITVKGGTFEGWNPQNNVSEGENTSFVAEGYRAIANAAGTSWTVVDANAVVYGDLNGDNVIDTRDTTLLRKYVLEYVDETALNLAAADVNGDGTVDTRDITLMRKYVAEIIDEFPVENQ